MDDQTLLLLCIHYEKFFLANSLLLNKNFSQESYNQTLYLYIQNIDVGDTSKTQKHKNVINISTNHGAVLTDELWENLLGNKDLETIYTTNKCAKENCNKLLFFSKNGDQAVEKKEAQFYITSEKDFTCKDINNTEFLDPLVYALKDIV